MAGLPIESLWDVDNTLYTGPDSLKAAHQLRTGNLKLPSLDKPPRDFSYMKAPHMILWSPIDILRYLARRPREDALKGLQLYQQVADLHGREVNFGILSGRARHLHGFTKWRIARDGLDAVFGGNYVLNASSSSVGFKQEVFKRRFEAGQVVVDTDDDIRVLMVGDRLLQRMPGARGAFLVRKNKAASYELAERAGIKFSDNVLIFEEYEQAAEFLSKRMQEGKL